MQTMNFNVGTDQRGLVSDVQNFKLGNDAKNWVQARQFEGEMRTVVINVMEGTIPLNLTGTTIWFEGLMSDGKTRIIDAKHGTILSPSTGQFRFEFPYAAFATFGSYKQSFFKIVRDGKSIATLEFTLDVLVNLVEDGLVPLDYITPFQDLYEKLDTIYQNADGEVKEKINEWQFQVTQLITNLNADYASIQTTVNKLTTNLDLLEEKIKANGLLTVDEFNLELVNVDSKFEQINKHIKQLDTFYDEITSSASYDADSKTNYYITAVPYKDKNGDVIKLKHGFANGKFNNGVETANSFYASHPNATLVINAAPDNTSGNVVADATLIQDDEAGIKGQMTLGLNEAGLLDAFDSKLTGSKLLAQKITDSWTGFFALIKNGKDVDLTEMQAQNPTGFDKLNQRHPRQVIAQKPDKSLLILTCEGRLDRNVGMTIADLKRILYANDVTFAYLLDGGGSISTINKGIMINAPIDDQFTTYRPVSDFMYIEKPNGLNLNPKNTEQNVTSQKANVAFNLLTKQLLGSNPDNPLMMNYGEKVEIPLLGDWKVALGRTPTYQVVNGVLYITGAICHKDSVFANEPWTGVNPTVNAQHGIEYPLFSLKSLPPLSSNHAPLAGLGGNGGDGRPIKLAFEKSNSTCYVYEREDMVGNRYINLDLSFVL
ncbi:BppU family phage baseplate upper protein [Latilactobacillus curvatus]